MEHDPSARADFFWSIAWVVFGTAIFYCAWTMDRLEYMHINPYTAPGLVPGVLGIGLVVLGVFLMLRSIRTGALGPGGVTHAPVIATGRLIAALVLCLGYAAGLVGRGLPFWAATFLFVTGSILIFQWPERRARGDIGKGAVIAAACGLGTAAAVTMVFQEIFLVRLP